MNTKGILVLFTGVLVGALGATGVYMLLAEEEDDTQVAEQRLTLPDDPAAQQVGECTPGIGEHFMNPALFEDDDTWMGPAYLLDPDTGEPIGVEYHVSLAFLEEQGMHSDFHLHGDPGEDMEHSMGEDNDMHMEEDMDMHAEDEHSEDMTSMLSNIGLFDASYNHMVAVYNQGHEGFETPHVIMSLFTITPEEREAIDCM